MICSVQNKQFIDKILSMKAKDIKDLIRDQDEKYIIRKQRQIIHNMPEHLRPNDSIQVKSTNILKNLLQVHHVNQKQAAEAKLAQFPSTFNQKTKPHHWNIQSKPKNQKLRLSGSNLYMQNLMSSFEGFKSGLEGEANVWKGEQLPDVHMKMNELEKVQPMEGENNLQVESVIKPEELGYPERELQRESVRRQRQPSLLRSGQAAQQADNESQVTFTGNKPQQIQIPNPFVPALQQRQKHSPFISNKLNFLDVNTNKKPIQQNYLTPQTYSMNMLHYAHNQKRQNTFGDGYSYPNVIMGGSTTGWMKTAQSIRDNPFKKTFVTGPKFQAYEDPQTKEQSLLNAQRSNARMESDMNFRQNVQQVLKYTLGDKRYTNSIVDRQKQMATSVNLKSNVMESSFQKQLPQKKQRILENPFVRRPSSTYKY